MHYCPSCGYNLERDPVVTIDGYVLDPTTSCISHESGEVWLTRSEYHLIYALAAAKGRGVSREPLMLRFSDGEDTKVIDVHVHRIRKKMRAAGWPNLIGTVRGHGFRWEIGAPMQVGGHRPA